MQTAAAALARRLLQHASGSSPQPAVIHALLRVLEPDPTASQDSEVAQAVLTALPEFLAHPLVLDAAWEAWMHNRQAALLALLIEHGQPAGPVGPAAVYSRLALGQHQDLADNPADIENLLQAAGDADPRLSERADDILHHLANPEARSELCRWVTQFDHPRAREIALASGYAPADLPSRALFFLLTGQWARYQELDFDAGLIEIVYAAGSETLRTQIAALARQNGLSGFARILTGSRLHRFSNTLTDFEWETVLVILNREKRHADLWRLAQNAPPIWSARLLHSLFAAGWQPSDSAEQAGFASLSRSAAACPIDSTGGLQSSTLIQHRAALLGHTRQVTALLHIPTHNLLASASAEKAIRLWDLAANRQSALLEPPIGHTDFVLSLAAAPDGSWLASGGADRSVRIWSLPEGRLQQVLGGHASRVTHLEVSPDGQSLLSGDERAVHTWQVGENFRPLAVIKNQLNGLNQLAVTQDNLFILVGDSERTVRIWSLPTPEAPAAELRRTLLTPIVGWTLNRGGSLLASSSSYGAVQLWSIPQGESIRTLPGRANNSLLSFSPDDRWLAVAASQSGRSGALLWDLALDDTSQPVFLPGGAGLTSSLAFHPASRLLAVASQDRTLRLWSIPASSSPPALLKILEGHNTPVRHLCFSSDGSTLFSAGELSIHTSSVELLASLLAIPAAQLQPEKLTTHFADPDLTPIQRAWLAYSLELARHQRRYDIEIGEVETLTVGEYDIEIA